VGVDKGEFRAVLGHFASGVTLITAVEGGDPAGLTCQSFFSLSLDPPLIAVAPSRTSTSWPKVAAAGQLCVNILSAEQEALARTFSHSGADKFAGVGWSPGSNGAPRLHGALAWIDCSVHEVHDAGDHFLVVGLVEALESVAGHPLLFYRGGFGGFEA
jgi:flavin reductase (DIM6/NTAB) family NADH-FMN oxidoreductase RutF